MFGSINKRMAMWGLVFLTPALIVGGGYVLTSLDAPLNLLTVAADQDAVTVLDFTQPFPPGSPPPGWRHRKFWFTPEMDVGFVQHQGETALRCETRGSGSILGRHTSIDIGRLPRLEWRWFVEVPISSERDESTREGDDHPVRLFLEFRDTANGRHAAEIIWANRRFRRGDTKYIGSFPHYVSDSSAVSGTANVGSWRDQSVDLLGLYRQYTGRTDVPRLSFIGVFCDSDNTGGHSVAYTSNVRLRR